VPTAAISTQPALRADAAVLSAGARRVTRAPVHEAALNHLRQARPTAALHPSPYSDQEIRAIFLALLIGLRHEA